MKISLAHLYLDFSLPRRLLGLCHAGKELVTKPLERLHFAWSQVLKRSSLLWTKVIQGEGGGGGIQPIFGYRLACVTGGFWCVFCRLRTVVFRVRKHNDCHAIKIQKVQGHVSRKSR